MAKRNDKEISSENYTFIKETIKEQPTKTGLPAKILTAALCGVIFGSCAACAMALIVPKALEKLGSVAEQKAVHAGKIMSKLRTKLYKSHWNRKRQHCSYQKRRRKQPLRNLRIICRMG